MSDNELFIIQSKQEGTYKITEKDEDNFYFFLGDDCPYDEEDILTRYIVIKKIDIEDLL